VFCEEGGISFGAFALFLMGHVAVLYKPAAFFYLGERVHLGIGALCLIFVITQMLLAFQLTPSGVGTLDGGLIGTFALMGMSTAKDAASCMAFLLCLRLWDAVLIGAGALLATRVGTTILSGKPAPSGDEEAPADPPPARRA